MKNILICFIAVLVSIGVCSLLINPNKMQPASNDIDNYKAFQIGSFKKYENAVNSCINYNCIIKKENDLYFVFYAILSNNKNIENMSNILKNKKINYYLKNINIDNSIIKKIDYYEKQMLETNSSVAFLDLNKKILDLYRGLNEN